ncbi:MAG TPA: ribokinase, partial [Candidatus Polarisedimenticolaceae bacterium]|nr:ribokinase [Candidatus Polarisedimenticolaceae bacterium]
MSVSGSARRVLVVGSANVDFTVAASRLPGVGETVSGGTLLVNHGGKGANQAVAARRLGAEVRFVACVGDDAPGRDIRAALQAEGVGVDGVMVTREAATGTALIVVDGQGRNQIVVAPGANWRLSAEHVRSCAEDFAWAQVVLCQLETPLDTLDVALGEARRRGLVTVLNPAPVRDGIPDDVWRRVDYLTPNEGEAARLSGVPVEDVRSASAAARRLRERGVGAVIVTLGVQGSIASTASGDVRTEAFPVNAVDTTAAGDSFNGALGTALAAGDALPDALRFASAAAAL